MSQTTPSEQASLDVAEAARETDWIRPSFMKELFLGNFRMDLIHPFPGSAPRPEFTEWYGRMSAFLTEHVDPVEIDRTGEYPQAVLDGLAELGCFGMKIPKEFGGLGFTQAEYDQVMQLLGSYCGNVGALLSAHQSIGLPQPLKLFGTYEQKQAYLPRCAKGAISGFALTEPGVGSDPANLATTAVPDPDGDGWILNGSKLWCTNATIAELLVVMARNPDTKKISAFIVETAWEGVTVEHRCRFMGLKALANAVISFKDVKVSRDKLIGQEGAGLKIALVTLNTGRLALPASASGTAKRALEICRHWCNQRAQWGRPIGKHEAIAHKLADMASMTFALDSISQLASQLADAGNNDIRLEAAAAKEYNTVQGWYICDETMQIRGGRGYETEESLASRGEVPIGVERMMRDFRIELIFEGSSEIMHLFIAREAVDKHLQVAGALIDPRAGIGKKLAALPGIAAFYGWWYPTRWLGWSHWPRHGEFGPLAKHVRFAHRASAKLAREIFHGMARYQAKLQHKQAFLFRAVDIGLELFGMAAAISQATQLAAAGTDTAESARKLTELHCRNARRKIKQLFHGLWHNDDDLKYAVARQVLEGDHQWLDQRGTLPLAEMARLEAGEIPGLPAPDAPEAAPAPAAEPAAAAQPEEVGAGQSS